MTRHSIARFRFPGLREAAWGAWYARRGLTAADVLASERPPYPEERITHWRQRYDRLPMEQKVENRA